MHTTSKLARGPESDGSGPFFLGLHGSEKSNIAGVVQLVERKPSKLDVAGSRPAARSISGVPVHKHLAGQVCMCGDAAASPCSETSPNGLAYGHS